MFRMTNPRCLIIGCKKGYREGLIVPHHHTTEYTLDIVPGIRPGFVADITKVGNFSCLGKFDEIYFEDIIPLGLQVALNVKNLLVPKRGKIYFIGQHSLHNFERIKVIYTPLHFSARVGDTALRKRIREKLFPQVLVDCFGTTRSVIELTQVPLPSFETAPGFLLNRN